MLTIDLDLLEIGGSEFILDAGSGSGRHIWQVCKVNRGASVAFDLDMPSLQNARNMLYQMDLKKESAGLRSGTGRCWNCFTPPVFGFRKW